MDITRDLNHVRIDAWLRPLAHNPLQDQQNREVFLRTALFNEHLNAMARPYGLYIQNTMGEQYAIDYDCRYDRQSALTKALGMRQALLPAALFSFSDVGMPEPAAV